MLIVNNLQSSSLENLRGQSLTANPLSAAIAEPKPAFIQATAIAANAKRNRRQTTGLPVTPALGVPVHLRPLEIIQSGHTGTSAAPIPRMCRSTMRSSVWGAVEIGRAHV